jgi:hypothetical protein
MHRTLPAEDRIHPIHPVEKSGFDPMVRIVANMIDPDRYQATLPHDDPDIPSPR